MPVLSEQLWYITKGRKRMSYYQLLRQSARDYFQVGDEELHFKVARSFVGRAKDR